MERQVRAQPAVPVVLAARAGSDPGVSHAQVLLSEPEEAAALYRGLSRQPALSAACLGPEVTTQYGGRYRTVHTGVCMEGNRVAGPFWDCALGWREGAVEGSLLDRCSRMGGGRGGLERVGVREYTPALRCLPTQVYGGWAVQSLMGWCP